MLMRLFLLDMGASSSKRAFFWQKKSPLERAWGHVKGALPNRRSRRKSILEKLKPGKPKKSKLKKRFSLTDKKEPELFKRFSLGNLKKGVRESRGKGEKRGSERQSKGKNEKNTEKEESSQQVAKKTEKYESKRPKIVWKSK
uniref:Uncharacterized protein n=1 Tax=Tetraodon nigroviridis TaxID=99883 RepID=H3BW07_TETNG